MRFILLVFHLFLFCPASEAQLDPATNSISSPAFRIDQRDGRYSLVKPDGREFFSLGVCVVDQGNPAKDFDTNNAAYAAWKHYPDSNAWASATLQRLKSWGFTTIGGWSDFGAFQQCA